MTARSDRMAPADYSKFFADTMMGYRQTKVLLVASGIGVFDLLADGPRDAAQAARALGCDPDALGNLLSALAGMGVLAVDGETFANADIAETHLVKGRPAYLGHVLGFHEVLWAGWSELEQVVRTGEPWRGLGELITTDAAFRREYIRGMAGFSRLTAPVVADLLSAGHEVRRFVDVGGGPGVYALAMVDRNPGLDATLLDLPTTLEIAAEVLAERGRTGDVRLRSGNYLEDDYGTEVDLVLLSHTTHDESPENVRIMFERAFLALRPGGRLAVHDWTVHNAGSEPLASALFSVNVMVYTRGGRVYSVRQYIELLEDVGFASIEVIGVQEGQVPQPTTLLVATRPG